MALLDFVRNRSAEQSTVTAKPQAQERSAPSVADLPDNIKAQAVEAAHPAAKLMERATQHRHPSIEEQSGHGDSREALMHNQSAHGKAQEAMSPTDSGKGHTQTQARQMGRSRGMER